MKKKLLLVLSTVVAASTIVATTSAKDADPSAIKLVVAGDALECEQEPVIVNNRTLLPLRDVAEAVGAEVNWDGTTKTVNVETDDLALQLPIGATQMTVDNKTDDADASVLPVEVPAQIINDRTMVPLRTVAETLGLDVNWDGDTRTVYIDSAAVEESTEAVSEESTEATTSEESTEAVSEESTEATTSEETSVEDTTVEETSVEDTTEAETETVSEETTSEVTTEA